MSNISGSCECETQQHTLKNNESLMKLLRSTPTVNMFGALYQMVTYTRAHTHMRMCTHAHSHTHIYPHEKMKIP